MHFDLRFGALALLSLLPLASMAETPPAPAADLAAITQRAGTDRNKQIWLQQMVQMKSRPSDARANLDQMIYQGNGNGRAQIGAPFAYRLLDLVQKSRTRAQYLGQIMTADLNNDGEITRQEVKDALSVSQVQGAAEAFFSSDANNDNVLQPIEIRAAVDRQVGLQGNNGDRVSRAWLFDFDDDGVLSPEEHDRGMVALGLAG
jgi:Tfp pilus assembly protein PilV